MQPDRLEAIFAELIEIDRPDQRDCFLDRVCGDDSTLRAELLDLIRAHESAGEFMDENIVESAAIGEAEPWNELPQIASGAFTVGERLGSGGFGVVYRARQLEPVRRDVALKVIKPGMDTQEVIARFDAERQALAMMDHPGIARVLDAGSTDKGQPYFVMELFEGQPITSYCDNHRLDLRQRLRLFVEVCDAVQHAHQKGIIHRDLKPSNILVADSSGKPTVKVIDFGIAKALHESLTDQTLVTHQGQPLGTPRYMSPEQFQESNCVDTRSDVYSLGVMLYELLTGSTPLQRGQLRDYSPEQLRAAMLDQDPQIPSHRIRDVNEDSARFADARRLDSRRLAGLVKGDLDWLVMKALEKDPERRYPSASDLASDVRHHLNHEPIDAGPPTQLYRLSKLARRNRTALAMTTLIALSLLAGTALATWNSWRATRAERLAEQRLREIELAQQRTQAALTLAEAAELQQRQLRQRAEAREKESRQLVYASDVRLAGQAFDQGDIRSFADLLDRQIPRRGDADLRGFEWWLLHNQATIEPTPITQGRSGCCLARFSPDGRFLVTGHYDGKLHLWDADTFDHLHTLNGHDSFANGIDFDPQGKLLASAGDDHQIRIWNLDSGEQIDHAFADEGHVHRVFFADHGQQLVSAGEAPEVKVWNRTPLKIVQRHDGFESAIHHGIKNRLDLSPDRRRVVAADQHQTARIYDLQTGETVCSLDLAEGQFIRCLRYSPDGRWIAGGRYTQEVTLWDAATGQVVHRFVGHLDDIQDIAFHPRGHLLASSDKSGIVRTWPLSDLPASDVPASDLPASDLPASDLPASDVPAMEKPELKTAGDDRYQDWPRFFVAHDDRVFSLDFSTDGNSLVTACRDGTVRRWQAKRLPRLPTGRTFLEPQAVWLNDTTLAVTQDTHLVFWDLADGKRISSQAFDEPIQSIALSVDGRGLVTGHFDGKIRIWNPESREVERTLLQHDQTIHSLAFAPWDDTLITAGEDGLLLRWNVAAGSFEELARFPDRCKTVAVSRQAPWLAAAVQNDIHLFRLDGSSPPKRLQGHLNSADCLAFSPDGKWLASGSDDRTVRLWDVERGTQRHVIHAHRTKVESIAFSPDGRTVVSGDKSAIVSFSHVETGRLLCSLDLFPYWNDLGIAAENPWISDLNFSNDGSHLVAGMFRIGYVMLRGPATAQKGVRYLFRPSDPARPHKLLVDTPTALPNLPKRYLTPF